MVSAFILGIFPSCAQYIGGFVWHIIKFTYNKYNLMK